MHCIFARPTPTARRALKRRHISINRPHVRVSAAVVCRDDHAQAARNGNVLPRAHDSLQGLGMPHSCSGPTCSGPYCAKLHMIARPRTAIGTDGHGHGSNTQGRLTVSFDSRQSGTSPTQPCDALSWLVRQLGQVRCWLIPGSTGPRPPYVKAEAYASPPRAPARGTCERLCKHELMTRHSQKCHDVQIFAGKPS